MQANADQLAQEYEKIYKSWSKGFEKMKAAELETAKAKLRDSAIEWYMRAKWYLGCCDHKPIYERNAMKEKIAHLADGIALMVGKL